MRTLIHDEEMRNGNNNDNDNDTGKKRTERKNKQKKGLWSEMLPSLALKLQDKDVNDKEYPPLFKFDIVRHIGLCSTIELECIFQLSPDKRVEKRYGKEREWMD